MSTDYILYKKINEENYYFKLEEIVIDRLCEIDINSRLNKIKILLNCNSFNYF